MSGVSDKGKPDVGDDALPQLDFATFVLSLSHSVLMHLGEVPPVEGAEGETAQKDLPLARQVITKATRSIATRSSAMISPSRAQVLVEVVGHRAAAHRHDPGPLAEQPPPPTQATRSGRRSDEIRTITPRRLVASSGSASEPSHR